MGDAPNVSDAGFETRAIHAGQEPDPATGAVVAADLAGDDVRPGRRSASTSGYEYARSGNPTRAALEACLASLEGAAHGLAFASGLAAEDAVLRAARRPGDHVCCSPTTPTAARSGSIAKVLGTDRRRLVAPSTSPTSTRSPRRGPTTPRWCGSRRRPTRC